LLRLADEQTSWPEPATTISCRDNYNSGLVNSGHVTLQSRPHRFQAMADAYHNNPIKRDTIEAYFHTLQEDSPSSYEAFH